MNALSLAYGWMSSLWKYVGISLDCLSQCLHAWWKNGLQELVGLVGFIRDLNVALLGSHKHPLGKINFSKNCD